MKWRHFIVHIDFCKIGGLRLDRSHYGEAVCRGAQGPHFGLCHWKHTYARSFLCGSVTTTPDEAPWRVAAGLTLGSSSLLRSLLCCSCLPFPFLPFHSSSNEPMISSRGCIFILLILGRIYLRVSSLCLILYFVAKESKVFFNGRHNLNAPSVWILHPFTWWVTDIGPWIEKQETLATKTWQNKIFC